MHSSIKFTILAVFCSLFLMQSVATAQKTPEKFSDIKKESGIIFPEIKGWEKGDITTYPTLELGYSLLYRSEAGGTVTVYVYDGGNKKISNGISDNIIKKELDKAREELKQAGELGYYDDVKEIKSDTIKFGGDDGNVESYRSLFNFSIRGTKLTSEIYIFGYDNNFIKLRATRPLEKEDEPNEAFLKLLAELDKVFSE